MSKGQAEAAVSVGRNARGAEERALDFEMAQLDFGVMCNERDGGFRRIGRLERGTGNVDLKRQNGDAGGRRVVNGHAHRDTGTLQIGAHVATASCERYGGDDRYGCSENLYTHLNPPERGIRNEFWAGEFDAEGGKKMCFL